MKVLFVESDAPTWAGLPSLAQRGPGWSGDVVFDLHGAFEALDEAPYDVAFIDWPADGSWNAPEICRVLVTRAPRLGRIVVSSRTNVADKVEALSAGADDFLGVPCDLEETVARANAVARRSRPPPSSVSGVRRALRVTIAPGVVADVHGRSVRGPAGEAELTPTQSQLLIRLAASGTDGASTESLALELLSRNDTHALNLVHRHVSNLRAKLRRAGATDVVGRNRVGYVLKRP